MPRKPLSDYRYDDATRKNIPPRGLARTRDCTRRPGGYLTR